METLFTNGSQAQAEPDIVGVFAGRFLFGMAEGFKQARHVARNSRCSDSCPFRKIRPAIDSCTPSICADVIFGTDNHRVSLNVMIASFRRCRSDCAAISIPKLRPATCSGRRYTLIRDFTTLPGFPTVYVCGRRCDRQIFERQIFRLSRRHPSR